MHRILQMGGVRTYIVTWCVCRASFESQLLVCTPVDDDSLFEGAVEGKRLGIKVGLGRAGRFGEDLDVAKYISIAS